VKLTVQSVKKRWTGQYMRMTGRFSPSHAAAARAAPSAGLRDGGAGPAAAATAALLERERPRVREAARLIMAAVDWRKSTRETARACGRRGAVRSMGAEQRADG
jgi:hypothetical protein